MSQNINSKSLQGSIPFLPQETSILQSSNMMQNLNGPISNGCQSKAPSLVNQGQQTLLNGSKVTHFSACQNNGYEIHPQQTNQIQSKVGSIIGNCEIVAGQSKNLQIISKRTTMFDGNCENIRPMSKVSGKSEHLNVPMNSKVNPINMGL